jgi:glucose/arabinose dehydrogenase
MALVSVGIGAACTGSETPSGGASGAEGQSGSAGATSVGTAGGASGNDGAGAASTGTGAAGSGGEGQAGASGSSGGASGVGAQSSTPDGGVEPDGPQPNCEAVGATELPALRLSPVTSDLDEPIFVAGAPGDATRLFVVEKPGRVRVVLDGVLLDEPFLDISDVVQDPVEEMGLLGLAFHPNYPDNRRFYVTYSTGSQGGPDPAHTEVLVEFLSDPGDPNRADVASARLVLGVAQPESNHNGGNLQFGPDRLLYWGLGDGGGGNDLHGTIGNGQALDTLLGKLVRIDVDGRGPGEGSEYAVPADNYFAFNPAALPEIWAVGLRNPWRFSFDACAGDLYIGDVGQESREEINYLPAGHAAGANFGWRLMEADECFNPDSGCDASAQGLTLPVASYGRGTGQAITGGYVYRGQAIPSLRGTYLYADYQSAVFFALRMVGGVLVSEPVDISDEINPGGDIGGITSFGQDAVGELYVVSFDGDLYRIEPE